MHIEKKYKIGYTQGVFDMFHIGHLNLLINAKKYCDYLIVGVNSDKLVYSYKEKVPVISEEDRCTIIKNIKVVDKVVLAESLDKISSVKDLNYNAIFIGSDWEGNKRWSQTKEELSHLNVDVVFLPYTKGVSSTKLRIVEKNAVLDEPESII
ncbi:adenylyltransferase/cytidyltransferase family protein [Enterococcus avium]|uniref:adenylyltransferase/cytidyltransferase family protein n=1 Tax=Enterococcus avium TaxID=33945 RepID=UPI0028902B59|nr:adenylyltransferase/cytidyltransferase family protein [Enterococcus avium]MDT2565984.1 adenylyltransferase/cytidyltransferase family protein [Enterococcus avium]